MSKLVFVESPYSGNTDLHVRYLMLCHLDAAARNEMPVSTHNCMTQHPMCQTYYVPDNHAKWDVLTRERAIDMGQALRLRCDETIFYEDMGWSSGMNAALEYCKKHQLAFQIRRLDISLVLSWKSSIISQEFIQAVLDKHDLTGFLTN